MGVAANAITVRCGSRLISRGSRSPLAVSSAGSQTTCCICYPCRVSDTAWCLFTLLPLCFFVFSVFWGAGRVSPTSLLRLPFVHVFLSCFLFSLFFFVRLFFAPAGAAVSSKAHARPSGQRPQQPRFLSPGQDGRGGFICPGENKHQSKQVIHIGQTDLDLL